MTDSSSVLDIVLGGAQSLIGKSLKPEDPCKDHAPRYSLVKLKPDDVRPLNGDDVVVEHAPPGPGLSRLELRADGPTRVLRIVDVHVVTVRVGRDRVENLVVEL